MTRLEQKNASRRVELERVNVLPPHGSVTLQVDEQKTRPNSERIRHLFFQLFVRKQRFVFSPSQSNATCSSRFYIEVPRVAPMI